MKTIAPPSRARRGSILIVAMLFSAIIGISLVTFINLGQTNLRISSRAFYQNAALDLAESGLEQAIWSVNQMIAKNPDAWAGWTVSGAHAYRNFTGFTFDANSTGNVRVYVQNHLGIIAPRLVARATITPYRGAAVEKWVKVDLTKRSLFANGLVAKNTITLNGGGASGAVYGAVVGNNITLNGGAEFHYDEALAALDNHNPYGIGSWEELTNAADRSAWLARLTF